MRVDADIIEPEETAGELAARLAPLGAAVMLETLDRLDALTPVPQRHEDATRAPRLQKSDGVVDWARPAREIVYQVRGCNPWPGATTRTPRGALTIWRATAVAAAGGAAPYQPVRAEVLASGVTLSTDKGALPTREVQPESRRAVAWDEFLRGARLEPGVRLDAP